MHGFRQRTPRPLLLLPAFLLGLIAGSAQAAEAPAFVADLQGDFSAVSDKIVSLAEAIPAEEYSWRPAEGVRSVSEALMHVAAANYFFPTLLGVELPEGTDPRALESEVTEKDEAIRVLQESVDHMEAAMTQVAEGSLEGEVEFAGQTMTRPGFLHFAVSHSHEHLGQLIAYARSVGVTPPWSQ